MTTMPIDGRVPAPPAALLSPVRRTLREASAAAEGKRGAAPGGHVLVAVSGGTDSVALLYILLYLREEYSLTLSVLHVNHGLRGAESDRDEAFVRALCESLSVPCETVRLRGLTAEASEAEARAARYRAFEETAARIGAARIATAHTADDNAETVLMNLARGAGPRGLGGIPPTRGKLLRPLICVRRAQLSGYLSENNIPHVEDSTNATGRYTRNRLRLEAIPALDGALGTPFADGVAVSAARLRQTQDFLRQSAGAARERCETAPGRFSVRALLGEHPALRYELFRGACREAGGGALSGERADALEAFLAAGKNGELALPNGAHVTRRYDEIAFLSAGGDPETPPFELRLYPGQTLRLPDGRYLTARLTNAFADCAGGGADGPRLTDVSARAPGMGADAALNRPERKTGVNIYNLLNHAVLDYDKMKAKMTGDQFGRPFLTIRSRRAGDRYRPTEAGEKEVRRLFIDRKLPREKRAATPLICTGSEIVWLPGFQPPPFFRPGARTKCAIILTIKENNMEGKLSKDIDHILVTEEQIRVKVAELGARITKDYEDKDLVLISVLKGSVAFMTDLMRSIDLPLTIDFMNVSSYGSSTKSSGVVRIIKDLDKPIEGKDVLVIEDILDSGLTLSYIMEVLRGRGPRSVRLCSFLDKPDRRAKGVDLKLDYTGFTVPDEFVVGYGLDYAQLYRNLPYVGVLKPEVYANPV